MYYCTIPITFSQSSQHLYTSLSTPLLHLLSTCTPTKPLQHPLLQSHLFRPLLVIFPQPTPLYLCRPYPSITSPGPHFFSAQCIGDLHCIVEPLTFLYSSISQDKPLRKSCHFFLVKVGGDKADLQALLHLTVKVNQIIQKLLTWGAHPTGRQHPMSDPEDGIFTC